MACTMRQNDMAALLVCIILSCYKPAILRKVSWQDDLLGDDETALVLTSYSIYGETTC